MAVDHPKNDQILDAVWAWSKGQGLRGYNKHDGLNSPVLRAFLGWAKWPRIVAIQTVMRFPFNLRPLLLVPKTVNPKGLALFAMGLLDRHISDPSGVHLAEAEEVLEMLLDNRAPGGWSGDCWGYPYPWQDLGFYAPPHTPNAVVTCFVCEAFLAAYRQTGKKRYLEVVESAAGFFLNDLAVLEDADNSLCLGYMPMPMTMRVMDVSILIGAVLAQLGELTADDEKKACARRLVNYVVDKQTDYGAWFYTDPPGDSLIRHDNYHTGFILDALWRFMAAADDWRWRENYELGLDFYARKLFNQDGSPRWMSDCDYPHDVHGSAQGLISFSLAVRNGYPYQDLLERIGAWAIGNLYSGKGRFFYRRERYFTKRYTLLRWCNAWMFRGMSSWNGTADRCERA